MWVLRGVYMVILLLLLEIEVICWYWLRWIFMYVMVVMKNIKKSCKLVIWIIYDNYFMKIWDKIYFIFSCFCDSKR